MLPALILGDVDGRLLASLMLNPRLLQVLLEASTCRHCTRSVQACSPAHSSLGLSPSAKIPRVIAQTCTKFKLSGNLQKGLLRSE